MPTRCPPRRKLAVTGAWDQSLRAWDVEKGKELLAFDGVREHVRCLALSSDGKHVLSCGDQNNPTIRIWDVASGKQLLESEPVEGGVLSLAVLPDGKHCITTGKDGVVRLWRWTR